MNADQEEPQKGSAQKYFHVEAATIASEDAGAAYQAPTLIAAGADAQHVSLLSAILNLPIALMYLRLPAIMKKVGSRKRAVVTMAFIDVLTWFPLIAAMYFIKPLPASLLIILWVINLLPGILPLPIRDSWLADSIPLNTMGRHLGLRAAISATVYLITFYTMGYILDNFGGKLYIGFILIAAIALGATLIKVATYSRISDNRNFLRPTEFKMSGFLREMKGEGLGRLVFYISMFHFAVSICSPLFAVYMITYLHFTYMAFALVFSSEFIGRVISAPFWGKFSDNVQKLSLIKRISCLIPLIPLLWLISANMGYLIIVQLLSGVLWAGFDICSRSLLYSTASPSKRVGYIIYERSLVTLCRALGALAGAGILYAMISVFGQGIIGIFLLSGVMRFVVARVMLPGIRIPSVSVEDSDNKIMTIHVPNRGVSRRRPVVPAAAHMHLSYPVIKLNEKEIINGRNLSERRRIIGIPTLAYREPLFRKPKNDIDSVHPHACYGIRQSEQPLVPRKGLFYRPEDWADFKSDEMNKIRFGQRPDYSTYGRRIVSLVQV